MQVAQLAAELPKHARGNGDYGNSLIERLRNCTRLGGPDHCWVFAFHPPWCCRAIGPSGGMPGNCALPITSSPFSFTQRRSPTSLISKVFHSPRGRSIAFFGVTPARTSGGIFGSKR